MVVRVIKIPEVDDLPRGAKPKKPEGCRTNNKGYSWLSEEDQYIRDNYGVIPTNELCKHMAQNYGRTFRAVTDRVLFLRLKFKRE